MAFFNPQTQFREIALVPQHTVLLFVDIQNYNCHRGGTLYKTLIAQGKQNVSVCSSLSTGGLVEGEQIAFQLYK